MVDLTAARITPGANNELANAVLRATRSPGSYGSVALVAVGVAGEYDVGVVIVDVKTVPGMLPMSFAVAVSWVYLQLAISPAPTNVTVAACATRGAPASNAAVHENITPKAIEANSRPDFLTIVSLSQGRNATSPVRRFPTLPRCGAQLHARGAK